MGSMERLRTPSRRRTPTWTVLVLALLSTVALGFWVVVFVVNLRHATGFRLERPLLLFVGGLLASVGAIAAGVAARSAWRKPQRAKHMILAAVLGLVATVLGGLLVVRSYAFHVMPRVVEVLPELEGSAAAEGGLVGAQSAGAAPGRQSQPAGTVDEHVNSTVRPRTVQDRGTRS